MSVNTLSLVYPLEQAEFIPVCLLPFNLKVIKYII